MTNTEIRKSIESISGIGELEQGSFLVEQGCRILERQCFGYLLILNELKSNDLFWQKWVNLWHNIDLFIINHPRLDELSRTEIRTSWYDLHDIDNIDCLKGDGFIDNWWNSTFSSFARAKQAKEKQLVTNPIV